MPARQLVMALYAEGPADERFLSILLSRTVERILAPQEIEVAPIAILHPDDPRLSSRAEHILNVASQAAGFHLLFVHSDTDSADWKHARRERIDPGFDLVRATGSGVCRHLVAVLPVHESEAWMLADAETMRALLYTERSLAELSLPTHAAAVEAISHPKETLAAALRLAQEGRPRRRRVQIAEIAVPLAERLDLDRLGTVPSYRRLTQDVTEALNALGIPP